MSSQISLRIRISEQMLYVLDELEEVVQKYAVSTSRYGIGNKQNSFKTPVGKHSVKQKIGEHAAMNEVFVARRSIGVLDNLKQQQATLPQDIITSRIMWLQGLEPGVNKGDDIDSYQRYIYIHGTSEEDKIGTVASHGCIRMRNDDVIDLFDQIETGCEVLIEE